MQNSCKNGAYKLLELPDQVFSFLFEPTLYTDILLSPLILIQCRAYSVRLSKITATSGDILPVFTLTG